MTPEVHALLVSLRTFAQDVEVTFHSSWATSEKEKIDQMLAEETVDQALAGTRRPRIVCLCGSTRFFPKFMEANYRETMAGRIVLSVGFFPHASEEAHGETVGIASEQKEKLDQLHLRKIDLADEILVLNQDGYVGESTAREVLYAASTGKTVRWLEPDSAKTGRDLAHIAKRLLTGDDAGANPVAP
jgi:hypothetical protein